ncbi:MAG: paraquat-inducible protein A [Pseudomonadota bacterium]
MPPHEDPSSPHASRCAPGGKPPAQPDGNGPWHLTVAFFDRFLGLWLAASGALLVAGWLLPVMTINTLLVFYDEVSILEGARRLLESGDYLLFALILLFTVVFPLGKLILAFWTWLRLRHLSGSLPIALSWIEAFGKWSMLDVFVVALLVVILKISLVSDVTVHAGLYVFTAAVVLSMVAVGRVIALAKAAVQHESSVKS